MAQTKIDLFFTLSGLDAHLELIPEEGEDTLTLLEETARALVAKGAAPRPQSAGRGAWSTGKPQQPKQLVPGQKCPNCGGPITEKTGSNKDTGKPWRLWLCADRGDTCFKKFQDVTPAPASTGNGGTVPKKVQPSQQQQQQEPVKFQPRATAATSATAPRVAPRATAQQVKKVRGLAALKKITDAALLRRAEELYGVARLEDLSADDAQDLASRLEAVKAS